MPPNVEQRVCETPRFCVKLLNIVEPSREDPGPLWIRQPFDCQEPVSVYILCLGLHSLLVAASKWRIALHRLLVKV